MEKAAGGNRHIFRNWWLSVSIRNKILIFTSTVVVMVLFITIFSVGMVGLYLRDFNVVLGDSYAVNQALIGFEKENAAFQTYANRRAEETGADYYEARREMEYALTQLRFSYGEMNIDRYLLTQAILTIHDTYVRKCDSALSLNRKADPFISEYYTSLKVAGYLSGYLQELMQETLEEGSADYYKKVERFRILPVAALTMGGVILLLSGLLGSMTVRHIIGPVIRLAGAAREIAGNNLDGPDVYVDNDDEIGQLVTTFNTMKHSMAESIATLYEINEMENRLHQENLQLIRAEQELKNMQFSMLQNQINPHFLFNTLNTINSTAKIENANNTSELIQRLANLFRYNLQTSSAQVPLTRDLNIIHDYIYIQRRRFGHRLDFEVDCRIDTDQVLVPTFTLQPLVENAVIHGISPLEEGGRIRVRIRKYDKQARITVTDNGRGIAPDRLAALMDFDTHHQGHISGIGVGNVRARLEMLRPGSQFNIFSRVGLGTTVRLILPVNPEEVQSND